MREAALMNAFPSGASKWSNFRIGNHPLCRPRSSVNREAGMLPAFNFVVTIGPDELAAFISGM